jgi:hypothetical protein
MLFRICVQCDHTNPPDSRFCGNCGAPLQLRFCRLCRSATDAAARYCNACGAELPEPLAPGTWPPPIAPSPAAPSDHLAPAAAAAATIALEGTDGRTCATGDLGDCAAATTDPALATGKPCPTPDAPSARPLTPRAALAVAVAAVFALAALAYLLWRTGVVRPTPDGATVTAAPPCITPSGSATAASDALAPAHVSAPLVSAQSPASPSTPDARPPFNGAQAPNATQAAVIAPPLWSSLLRECPPAFAALGACLSAPTADRHC